MKYICNGAQAMKVGQTCVVFGLTILLITTWAGCGAAYPTEYRLDNQSQPSRCFTATGHTVRGNFLGYFEAMGGVESLGYPITEPFEQEGRRVQYFDYARLEDHPDNPGGPVVKLSILGERLGRRQPPLAPSRVPSTLDRNSRYYPQTGHAVSGDFLAYFDKEGGLDRFGFPIAEPLVAGGKLVQDFQRARFVWSLDHPPDDRVTLESIGRVYFEAHGLDPALLAPIPCPPDATRFAPVLFKTTLNGLQSPLPLNTRFGSVLWRRVRPKWSPRLPHPLPSR